MDTLITAAATGAVFPITSNGIKIVGNNVTSKGVTLKFDKGDIEIECSVSDDDHGSKMLEAIVTSLEGENTYYSGLTEIHFNPSNERAPSGYRFVAFESDYLSTGENRRISDIKSIVILEVELPPPLIFKK